MQSEFHILFPFNKVKKDSRVILYGAGDVGQTFYHQAVNSNYCNIIGWIDKSWEDEYVSSPFCHLSDIGDLGYDVIIIAVKSEKVAAEISEILIDAGVDSSAIVTAADCIHEYILCELNNNTGDSLYKRLAGNLGIATNNHCESIGYNSLVESSEKQLGIGILTTGYMASVMATTITRRVPQAKLVAVAGRDKNKAEEFARDYGIDNWYGEYRSLMENPDVELIHIASPAAFHYEHTIECLEHGKHVLCEKPFALSRNQAEIMYEKADEKGLLLADGLWTRYMPLATEIENLSKSGIIGVPFAVSADVYYKSINSTRVDNLDLGGGVLLENGLYLLSFVSLVFGMKPGRIHAEGIINGNGVDIQDEVILFFGDAEDKVATLNFGIRGNSDRRGYIYGTDGFMEIQDAHDYKKILIYDKEGRLIKNTEMDDGYQYEIIACINAIRSGDYSGIPQSREMTLDIMAVADEIRRQIGLVYPFEKHQLDL